MKEFADTVRPTKPGRTEIRMCGIDLSNQSKTKIRLGIIKWVRLNQKSSFANLYIFDIIFLSVCR